MAFVKAKKSDLPAIKKVLLEKQGYRCPITGRDMRSMNPSHICVDHDHRSGLIRAALPRGINGLEGKVVVLLKRFGGFPETDVVGMAKCLHGLADFLMLHRTPQTEMLHPSHISLEEKVAKRNAAARKRYAAKK